MLTISKRNQTLTERLAIGAHLAHIKRSGLADHIGGFYEWAASIGYSRHHADRLVRLAEFVTR